MSMLSTNIAQLANEEISPFEGELPSKTETRRANITGSPKARAKLRRTTPSAFQEPRGDLRKQ